MALTKIKLGNMVTGTLPDANIPDDITIDVATAVPASGLTGSTLASGVTASSLTSVSTLTGLATSGNVGVGSATTSSPSSASRTLRIQHASGSASLVLCGDNDNETAWDILANTSGQLDMRKNNSSKLLIETDGTVVTSGALQPGGNVTIAGNLTVNGTGSDVITGDYLYLDAHNNTGAKNLVFRQLDDTWLGQIEFHPSSPAQIVTRVAQPLKLGANNIKVLTLRHETNQWGAEIVSQSPYGLHVHTTGTSSGHDALKVSRHDDAIIFQVFADAPTINKNALTVQGTGTSSFAGLLQAKRGFTAGQALDIEGDTFGRTNSGNIALGYRQDGAGDLLVLQQSSNNVFTLDGEGRTYLNAHSNARTSLNVIASGTGQAPNDAKVYVEKNSHNDWSFKSNAGADDYGYSTNGAGNYALYVTNHNASSTQTFRVEYDGDILAANTSISSISDRRLKKEITNASSQWDDIKALNFVNYKWKKSTGMDDSIKYLGLVADEVESVSPSLIKIDAQSKEDIEAGVEDPEYKTVKYSIVWMKAVKALQEAMAKIETLEAKVTALENA